MVIKCLPCVENQKPDLPLLLGELRLLLSEWKVHSHCTAPQPTQIHLGGPGAENRLQVNIATTARQAERLCMGFTIEEGTHSCKCTALIC